MPGSTSELADEDAWLFFQGNIKAHETIDFTLMKAGLPKICQHA
jgi:hypothetical protein